MNQSTQQPGNSERGPQSLYTPLSGSLRGIELVSSAHEIEESDFYAVVNTYPTEEWLKFDSNPELKCGKKDTKKMARWARQFYHSLEVLWDNQWHNHIRGRVLPATTENLRELLARIEFREAPTLFYLSGHTEIKDQERTCKLVPSVRNRYSSPSCRLDLGLPPARSHIDGYDSALLGNGPSIDITRIFSTIDLGNRSL
ncbi:hypothetical protein RHS02_06841, partial [Rhizoctonia solani]